MFSSKGPSVHRGGQYKRCVGRLPVSAAARTRAQQRAWAPSPRAVGVPDAQQRASVAHEHTAPARFPLTATQKQPELQSETLCTASTF